MALASIGHWVSLANIKNNFLALAIDGIGLWNSPLTYKGQSFKHTLSKGPLPFQEEVMNLQEYQDLLKEVEKKGIPWSTVEEKTKVPKQIMDLYAKSGPVPVTLIKSLKSILQSN